ncbi:DNA-binding NarL/FixJ family response regulator [Chitinophaga dinghuensis]|uniref:DNA-binding NarL/FixJ family response regulator n=1 Tax=Chitinophaga dinghuensis TaxID=1539050 RepID=A0A327VT73_9BACT|nr:response regulator transcription factor [Chitinophaga dinghuensis]RAJ79099.1 DNA-binding NarL/FixJ family response regulator [Chitinophaga dinghuensis]
MNSTDKTRIILADAQPVFREGIKSLLTDHPQNYRIEEAGNSEELRHALLSFQPDLLILDYDPCYFDAEELFRTLSVIPECKVIIISGQREKVDVLRLLDCNVYCFLTKECRKMDVRQAIQYAIRGEKFFCSFALDVLLADRRKSPLITATPTEVLSTREMDIIRRIVSGKSNKEIAGDMHLSQHTVHTHRRNIMRKLQLHSAVELCNYALANGIVRTIA